MCCLTNCLIFFNKTTPIFRYLANASLLIILRFHCFLFGSKKIVIVFSYSFSILSLCSCHKAMYWLHYLSASFWRHSFIYISTKRSFKRYKYCPYWTKLKDNNIQNNIKRKQTNKISKHPAKANNFWQVIVFFKHVNFPFFSRVMNEGNKSREIEIIHLTFLYNIALVSYYKYLHTNLVFGFANLIFTLLEWTWSSLYGGYIVEE
jgi:hypothetical protein